MQLSGLVVALSLLPAAATAQTLLLPGTADNQPFEIRLETPAGTKNVATRPARLSGAVTLLIDSTLLGTPALGASLAKLFVPRKDVTVVLAVLLPSGEVRSATATTRAQLTAALRSFSASVETAPASFDALLRALRFPATDSWTQLIYLGPEPQVAPNLRDYAYSLLLRTLAEHKIHFSHAYPADTETPAWAPQLRAFGGNVSAEPLPLLVEPPEAVWAELPLPASAPETGFRVLPLAYRARTGETRTLPWIWCAPDAALPEVPAYEDFLTRRTRLAANPSPAAADFAALLAVNPSDLDTLKLASDFADRTRDVASVIRHSGRVVELEPGAGSHWARLGLGYWQSGDHDNAERCLLRARQLNAGPPESAAILGDLRAGKKDPGGAATYYREALTREPDRVELWLKLADNEQALDRKLEVALSLEEALKRKPDLWPRRTHLIDYYLETADTGAARRHVATAIPLLPGDTALVVRYAAYAERLGQPRDALGLWTRAIELDPANELAHYSLTSIHRADKAWDKTLAAAEKGTLAVPGSARLVVLQADALLALGRIEDTRRVLKPAVARLPDSELLRRAADLEDRFGSESPKHYRALVEVLRTAGQPESSWRPHAERGLQASIREKENQTCEWFATLLNSKQCAPEAAKAGAGSVILPGGHRALLFMAHGPAQSSSESFLADYSRTIALNLANRKGTAVEAYRDRLIEYFRLLADLEAMGKRGSGKTEVRLSLENKNAARLTERVLSLIGWRYRRDAGKLVVEPAIKGKRSKRQDLASALALDVVSMQEALQAGGEFVLEIADEPVRIFPAEKAWQDQFYSGERYPGGIFEAMARKPAMASLYAALGNMEQGSAALLVESVGMKPLAEKYSSLLSVYSSCLEISAGRVEAPGGRAAAPVWAAVVRAQPTDPRRFLRELLDKDDGRLLRFYFLLSQLDMRRQRFFTASAKRTTAFYEVFRDSSQVEHKTSRPIGSASIEDLLRELPIDAEGHLEFPGSPEVWLLAKGKSDSVQTTDRRLKRLSRVTTPEVEDEILLRLLKSEYTQNHMRLGKWQNLLAVVRVDATRTEPLDEAAALLLAENFSAAEGLYGYFSRLSGLEAKHYREIFGFAGKAPALEWKQADVAVGLFDCYLYLLAHAESSRRLEPAKTAALLEEYLKALNRAASSGQRASATLDAVNSYLQALGIPPGVASLREILAPVPADSSFDWGGKTYQPGADFRRGFDRILQLQSVPRLDEMLRLHAALAVLASGKGDPQPAAAAVLDIAKGLRDPEVPRTVKIAGPIEDLFSSGNPSHLASLNNRLQKEVARKKPSGNLPKLAAEYWEALAFRTTVALAGQVYAANLRADDLLVAEDPLFLRKHRFVPLHSGTLECFSTGMLDVASDGAGSFVNGGFDGIAAIAGSVGAAGLRNQDAYSGYVSAALLGSVRTTDWSALTAQTLRSTAVQIHAAKDWLVLGASDRRVFDAIGASTYGLLSLNRRARLLLALERRDWESAWASLSLTDLLFLAARLRDPAFQLTASSPSIAAYLAAPPLPEKAGVLGPALTTLRRYAIPTLVELPAYEDTAAEPFPNYLGERLAEFKLYLAYLFAREGLAPEGLPALAETAARDVLGDLQMSDYRDWPTVIAAYAAFDLDRLREALGTK